MKNSKYVLLGLSVFCLLLIAVTSFNNGILAPLRTGVGYFLIPIQSGVNVVGESVYNNLKDMATMKDALAENEELKSRVAELMEENNRLQEEQFELARLRELYELDQEYLEYEKVGARVIAKDTGNWFQVFRIDKGSDDGIEVNMNVMAGGGLVGIVTDVGANYATVRSIIDDSSNVSAMSARTGENCIVTGDLMLFKEGRLSLSHIRKDADIQEGDTVSAGELLGFMGDTGYGTEEGTRGKFPVHLHVGIYLYENDQEISVNPYPALLYVQEKKVRGDF